MTFTEANTVEAHLRDLLTGGKIAGLGWHYVASTQPESFGLENRPMTGRWRLSR